MSLTPSNMVPLGTKAPDFELRDALSSQLFTYDNVREEVATVIMFICNHCPYVKHVQSELVKLAKDYQSRDIGFAAISSNDIEAHPEDAPAFMKAEAIKWNYSFPYLFDESQEVAKRYDAACTPDFYIFNNHDQLVYRGQLDDSRPGNGVELTGNDIRKALDYIIQGMPVDLEQKPSQGCNIKWK